MRQIIRQALFAAALGFASLSLAGEVQAAQVAPDGFAASSDEAMVQDVKKGWGRGGRGRGWGVGGRPPGWSHGRKRGWRGYGMPPGQYRKRYRGYGGPMLNTPYYF